MRISTNTGESWIETTTALILCEFILFRKLSLHHKHDGHEEQCINSINMSPSLNPVTQYSPVICSRGDGKI